jgi:hypothetical protein
LLLLLVLAGVGWLMWHLKRPEARAGMAALMPPEPDAPPLRPAAASPPSQPPTLPPEAWPKAVVPKPVSPSDRVSLDARFAVVGSGLEIAYTVENRRNCEIWVLDIKEVTSPPYHLLQSPRIRFEPPETAVLACWWDYQPPPPGTTWVTPPVFYGTRVPPGRTYTNTIRMPLPLAGESGLAPQAGREVACAQARFELAVILDWREVDLVQVAGKSLGRLYQPAMATQRVLSAEARPVRVPMVLSRGLR